MPFSGLLLEELPGPLQLALSGRGQGLAGAVDEEVDHANPRADALRADLLAGHHPGDRLGVLVEQALRRVGGDRLDLTHPPLLLLFGHGRLRGRLPYLTQTVLMLTNSRAPTSASSRP